ncbi:MAG: Na+/H+ antiporter NhaD and related arsenite permeases [uncultured Solirubrobacterales bacterium]|uniref:Na+/H+ antiporter NhaD and related arsenite permeases n=1 Tax=uncultured Solirubrobacterales bacterium TaxID=768556 RepID=A0A6J4SPU9_9ACTN|nr:MAG: Na+/H+ antiporter NhaD and related arsenite permeases [uncultured Solirubrobacterales bacterium]
MALAVVVFLVALAIIASERVHRTQIALIGAAIVVVTGVIDQERATEAVDFNTIGLLVGMMIVVRLTEPTGVYNYLAIRAGQLARGRPLGVVIALTGTTAILSAFLDNLTTILLMVPITFLLADTLDVPAIPLIVMEIIASNLGGTATLIGDPPNILIAGATGLSFNAFLVNLAPIAALTLVVVVAALYLFYRPQLQIAQSNRDKVMSLDARRSIESPAELKRTLPILVLTILAFFAHQALGLEPATVALTGAAAMLLASRQSVEEALGGIEWATLFFFLGLFVMVGALEVTGAIDEVAQGIGGVTGGDRTAELLGITWIAALGSGVVDNIPFTAAMIPVVEQLQGADGGDDAYWWALSLGACFGGNATLIAAAANVAASGLAQRAGAPISFMSFLRIGLPVTLLSMVMATGYIAVRYL